MGFVERFFLRFVAVVDCPAGRGHHDALDISIPRCPQHAERTFPRGHNQLILMRRSTDGEWGRHMQYVVAPGDGFLPAGITSEIGRKE